MRDIGDREYHLEIAVELLDRAERVSETPEPEANGLKSEEEAEQFARDLVATAHVHATLALAMSQAVSA